MTTVVDNERIHIERLELGPFGTNAYIFICQKTKESAVVDAPGEAGKVVERLRGTQPKYILMTHDHFDHIGGLVELRSALKVPVAAHRADAGDLPLKPDLLLDDGDDILIGANRLRVLHTPGHTSGSLCFFTDKYLIAGDTLFPGGPGKTQSPDDFRQLIQSITAKLLALPEDTEVYPGHGEATTIGEAQRQYEVFAGRPHNPNLCGDVEWLLF